MDNPDQSVDQFVTKAPETPCEALISGTINKARDCSPVGGLPRSLPTRPSISPVTVSDVERRYSSCRNCRVEGLESPV